MYEFRWLDEFQTYWEYLQRNLMSFHVSHKLFLVFKKFTNKTIQIIKVLERETMISEFHLQEIVKSSNSYHYWTTFFSSQLWNWGKEENVCFKKLAKITNTKSHTSGRIKFNFFWLSIQQLIIPPCRNINGFGQMRFIKRFWFGPFNIGVYGQ